MCVSCRGDVKSDDASRKVKYESAVEANASFESSYFPGKVIAATDVNLGFRVAGIIDDVCAEDGRYVHEGDIIARLDSRDYALQLSATQAEYDAIKSEVDRVVALYADQSVSTNDYDKATNGLKAITAKLEAHKNALADTELRAPFNGYIQKSNFGKGEAVAAGTPVISIISDTAPQITIDIPAANYLKHSRLMSATASIDIFAGVNFPLIFNGITPKANLNQLYKLTFTLDTSGDIVPSAGMSAMVELRYYTESESDESVIIPFSAIVESSSQSSVWVVSNNAVQSRKVTVSEIKSDGRAVISDGLKAGERVVVAGVNSLKEGQKVTLLQEASASNIGGIK